MIHQDQLAERKHWRVKYTALNLNRIKTYALPPPVLYTKYNLAYPKSNVKSKLFKNFTF